jgi:pilus assembly protein CpaB
MDVKKVALLIGALVIAVVTAVMARNMFAGASTPQANAAPAKPQGPKVLVAKRALPLGTIITADAVAYKLWPKELVQDAYFVDGEADMSKLLGTVVRNPITAGEPITQGALVAPGDRGFLAAALGPGMRAITVPVSEKTAVGGFVFPGDHVDLMLTQSVSGEGQALNATETILQNLRVLATDQKTETTTNEDGKTVVKAYRTVTLEATPKIAEKIAVAQTIGTLSLSLRSLADSQSDLDRAIAEGSVKVPDGLSKDAESKLLAKATANNIQDGPTSFVTGGDVSRFQRRSMPTQAGAAPAPAAATATTVAPAVPMGPTVRVFRGQAVTVQPIAGAARGLVGQTAKGAGKAAGTVPGATAASMIAG